MLNNWLSALTMFPKSVLYVIIIGVASTLQLGGPHIVKDEMQVEDQLSMLNWGVLP